MLAGYARNREILLNELPGMGFDVLPADGAFYLYADISRRSNDSLEFCARLLDATGVGTTPGVDFDRRRGTLGDQALFRRSRTRHHRGDAAAENVDALNISFVRFQGSIGQNCFT